MGTYSVMPKVELCASTLPKDSEAMDFRLFYPVCIREDNKEQDDTEYFKQAISLIKQRYKGKTIHVLLADTLDRYNRCTPEDIALMKSASEDQRAAIDERIANAAAMARADGDRWIEVHEPILTELELERDSGYVLHRWDDFLSEAGDYLEQFERTLSRQGTIQAFKNAAKHYRKNTMQDYSILPQEEKELVVNASTRYFVEDYGVTYYIASQEKFKPAIFFSKNQNKNIIKLFEKCNKLRLNGSSGVVHLQLTYDCKRRLVEQESTSHVLDINGNHATIFNGGMSGYEHYDRHQKTIINGARIQGLRAQMEALKQVRSDLQRMNNEQINKINEKIDGLLEEIFKISEQQVQTVSGTGIALSR
jgi:hypothetical protein